MKTRKKKSPKKIDRLCALFAPVTREEWEEWTVPELKDVCRMLNVSGYSNYPKYGIIQLILKTLLDNGHDNQEIIPGRKAVQVGDDLWRLDQMAVSPKEADMLKDLHPNEGGVPYPEQVYPPQERQGAGTTVLGSKSAKNAPNRSKSAKNAQNGQKVFRQAIVMRKRTRGATMEIVYVGRGWMQDADKVKAEIAKRYTALVAHGLCDKYVISVRTPDSIQSKRWGLAQVAGQRAQRVAWAA